MRPLGLPPNERDNWGRLNEGQRRYAWEQYNLALVRRGRSIDHPIPDISGDHSDADSGRTDSNEQQAAASTDSGEDGDEDAEAILNNLPEAPTDSVEDIDESYFERNSQGSSNQRNHSMADSSLATPTKPPNKRQRVDDGASTSKLPGTAQGQGGNNLGEDSVRPFKLPKPTVSVHSHIRYFRKVHRFFTYGYAYKVLNNFPNNNFQSMTTPLALVPWDWLYFYMNPSEYATLPNQASVQKLAVKVYQRNVRVAFPTNSTANALATLNQNKNVIFARGLNKKMDIIPAKYDGFQQDQPMIPNKSVKWKMDLMRDDSRNWYGDEANTETNPVTPRHQFGQPDVLQLYAHVLYRKGATHDGWECLQSHVEESDADATSGGLLCECSYKPVMGLIKTPHRQVNRAHVAGDKVIPRGSHNLSAHQTVVTLADTGVTSDTNALQPIQSNVTYNSTVQIIEKSQSVFEGLFAQPDPQAQDSLHIGVQPTYALTSTNTSVNNSFTDTQAFFEVVAECWVDTSYPTYRPLTTYPNVHISNYWSSNKTGGRYYAEPLVDGLYQYANE